MAKILKFNIHTGAAWLIWAALLTWAYYHPNPQFPNYAIWLTAGVTAYTGKRLLQRKINIDGLKT